MAALVTPAARVSELMAQGRKSAAALEALLQVQDDHAGIREITAEILCCGDRALAALDGKPGRKKRKLGPHGAAALTTRPKRTRTTSGETAAATRVERKQNWDDGFVWTKYGQKDIRGSDHPRHYFRCADYTLDAGGCPARRQVQRSEEQDPPLYVLTYFADHTCCHGAEAAFAALDDVKILDFGSVGSRSPRPDDGDAPSGKTSRSEELPAEVAKVESTPLPDMRPAGKVAELSSSTDDIHYCSSSWESAAVCCDWDFFGNCSFDYVSEFFDVEDIALYR
ncbi:transcription factor WRKY19-like [Triticum aestivum]|nr:transcription factor WRKY19-like [Triticum aestivum]